MFSNQSSSAIVDNNLELNKRKELRADMAQPGPGITPSVKYLYNHSTKDSSSITWSVFEDVRDDEENIKTVTKSYAVVHRRQRRLAGTNEIAWKTDSIVINGNQLRGVLRNAFKGYPRWIQDKDKESFIFRPPFQQFFHCWEKLSMALNQDESTHDVVTTVLSELTPLVKPYFEALQEIKDRRLVSFDQLWLIFPPGEMVITLIKGNLSCCEVIDTETYKDVGGKHFIVKMQKFDWNGRYCGFTTTAISIDEYYEPTFVVKLAVYPLTFAGDEDEVKAIRTKLLRRGRKFGGLRGFHVMKCKGDKFVCEKAMPENTPRPVRLPTSWLAAVPDDFELA
jgi:hypothetical protein